MRLNALPKEAFTPVLLKQAWVGSADAKQGLNKTEANEERSLFGVSYSMWEALIVIPRERSSGALSISCSRMHYARSKKRK